MKLWQNISKITVMGALLFFINLLPVQASPCRTLNGQAACILDIQRSAKHYWEYRVKVKVDSVTYPIALYNCRDRFSQTLDGEKLPFAPEGIGDWICHLLKK
jgi:hypothetical protein